jgi:hypothetical protein
MKKCFPSLLASIWLASVTSGLGILFVYDHTAGADTSVPAHWPSRSKLPEDSAQPTLIMFAHPKCPCTRASIGELAVLMTHFRNRVNARVIFFRPKGSGEEWLDTDLWRSAEAIPGVIVQADQDGNEARCFQVTTSGHVLLYDVGGKLLFSGGITLSRGHSGDNEGSSAITKWLNHDLAAAAATPVFGCSLLNPKSECRTQDSAWMR